MIGFIADTTPERASNAQVTIQCYRQFQLRLGLADEVALCSAHND